MHAFWLTTRAGAGIVGRIGGKNEHREKNEVSQNSLPGGVGSGKESKIKQERKCRSLGKYADHRRQLGRAVMVGVLKEGQAPSLECLGQGKKGHGKIVRNKAQYWSRYGIVRKIN